MNATATATAPVSDQAPKPAPARRRRSQQEASRPPLRGLLPLFLLLVVWELLEHGKKSPFFPPPSQWYSATRHLWETKTLVPAILSTMETFALSLIIATVIGTVLGIIIGRVAKADALLGPLLEYLRFLPSVVLVPLLVLFAGYTESMKLYIVVFGAVWPVLLQVRLSARRLESTLVDVGRSLQMSRMGAFRKLFLPHVVPDVLLGVKISAPLTLVLVLVVEISTQVSGVGRLLSSAQQNFLSAQVYGLIVIVGVIALIINSAISVLESRLLRHRPKAA